MGVVEIQRLKQLGDRGSQRCMGNGLQSDALFDSRPFRLLTTVDGCSREGLATVPRANFSAFHVVEILDRLAVDRVKRKTIRVDNGPEFAGRLLDQRAYLNGVELDFSRPRRPTDNAFIEAFNARIRAECLNASWFLSMPDARDLIEAWRIDYNTERPHSALGHLTPVAFAHQAQHARKVASGADQSPEQDHFIELINLTSPKAPQRALQRPA